MDKDIWGKKETFTAKETNDTDDHLNTYYKQVADNAHGAKNNEKIYSTITESDFEKAQSDYYNSDASSTASIIQEMKDYLEDAKAQSEAVEDPDMYGLNMSWSEIQELYGVDGKSGTYVNMARKRAENTANTHYHDTETAANTSAIEAVKEDMNAFQEEHKVKMKKDEKEEPIDDI